MDGGDVANISALNRASVVINSPNIVCECGCKTFIPAVVLKRVSALTSPTGKEEIVDVPVYICSKCGNVPQFYKDKPNFDKIFGETKKDEILTK